VSGVVRYRLAESVDRRLIGVVISALGVAFLGLIGFMWATDAEPPVVRVAVLAALGLAVTVTGALVAIGAKDVLVVDLDTRRVTTTGAKDAAWSASLDEIAPVTVVRGTRRLRHGHQWYVRPEYRVVASGRPDLQIYRRWHYAPARRHAERLARLWRVALRPFDERIRTVAALDQPLWAMSDAKPSMPAPLPADAGVTIEVGADRAVIASTVMSRTAVAPDYLLLLWAGMAGLAVSELPVQVDLESDVAVRVLYYAVALIGLGTGGWFLWQVRRWLAPSVVTIDGGGVSYRGRTLPLAAVREVVCADELVIAGARRALVIEPGFCAPGAVHAVAGEIRRLVVWFGQRPGAA
jgi:hypothetical protein